MIENNIIKENVPPQTACEYLNTAMWKVVDDLKRDPPQDHVVVMSVRCNADKSSGELSIETHMNRCQKKQDDIPKKEDGSSPQNKPEGTILLQTEGSV